MDIIIRNDHDAMSEYAANIVAQQIRSKPDSVLGLATGRTPLATYRQLIGMHQAEGLDFSQIKTFNLDEYLRVGIDLNKPYAQDQSYARFMYEELFRHINIRPENTHIPDGLTDNPREYCVRYEETIRQAGGIDLQLLGLGCDGHWGFNEPGSSLHSRTNVVALTKQTLDDNYAAFYRQADIEREQMPHFAITMGVGTILEAKSILMLVSGAKKADITARCLEGPVTSQVTASAIQLFRGDITVVLDEAAATKLAAVEHYRHVEQLKRRYGL